MVRLGGLMSSRGRYSVEMIMTKQKQIMTKQKEFLMSALKRFIFAEFLVATNVAVTLSNCTGN